MPEPVLIHRSDSVEVIGVSMAHGDWVQIKFGDDQIAMPWSEFVAMVQVSERKIGGGRDRKSGVGGEDF